MTTGPVNRQNELRGIAVYPDIVIGKAHLIDRSSVKILYQCFINGEDLNREVKRFKEAVQAVENQFVSLKRNMPDKLKDQRFILDSHLMILKDGMLYDSTIRAILEERINAEWALKKSLEEIREVFQEIDDDYISNRISDVENVTERLLRTLSGDTCQGLGEITQRVIIVAHDLSPADTTELNTARVMGFITDVGGKTSHTAIMAQAFEIPAVVGLETATSMVKDGDLLIVDGSSGVVVINPDDAAIIRYQERKLQLQKYKSRIARTSHLPAETPDGHRVTITANIEFLEEVTAAKDHGGEGIGLYRTEFLYLRGGGFPDEEELFEDYREVVEMLLPLNLSDTHLEQRVARYLNISPTGGIMDKLRWLGLFSDEKVGGTGDTSAAMMSHLLQEKREAGVRGPAVQPRAAQQARQHRPAPQRHRPRLRHVGRVVADRAIHQQRQIHLRRPRWCQRPIARDLLLHRTREDDMARQRLSLQTPQHLQRHRYPDPVIQGLGTDEPPRQAVETRLPRERASHRDLQLLAVLQQRVDPRLRHGQRPRILLVARLVGGLDAHDGAKGPPLWRAPLQLRPRQGASMPGHRHQTQAAIGLLMTHHEPHFVQVGGQQDTRSAGIQPRPQPDDVAHRVHVYPLHQRPHPLYDSRNHVVFVSRDPVERRQGLQAVQHA